MNSLTALDVFVKSRDLLDLPDDILIDWATTCSNRGLRLRAKALLRRRAAREGKRMRKSYKANMTPSAPVSKEK